MLKWSKLDAGEYESSDKRFYVLWGSDRIYGNHWVLYDRSEPDYYKSQYHEATLRDCKLRAEGLLKLETVG